MKEVTSCPLGSKCTEEAMIDGEIVLTRCAWHVAIDGTDQQGNVHSEYKCSMAWMPILQIEMAGTNRGQTQALESFRNEMVNGNEQALDLQRRALNAD